MISTKRLKKKPLGARTITTYFKLYDSDYAFTGDVILNHISVADTHIYEVKFNDNSFNNKGVKSSFCKPENYDLGESYSLQLESTFNMLDNLNCSKAFLHLYNPRRNLTYTFAKSRNMQGLLWMYKKLIDNKNATGDECDLMSTLHFIDDVWEYAGPEFAKDFIKKLIRNQPRKYRNYE